MNHGKFFDSIRISPENLAKMKRYREAVAGLEEVPIICPRCNRVADRVFADTTGHKNIRCFYCKLEFVSSLPQFYSIRTRRKKKEKDPYRWW